MKFDLANEIEVSKFNARCQRLIELKSKVDLNKIIKKKNFKSKCLFACFIFIVCNRIWLYY